VNHAHSPKEVHLPDCASRDNQVENKGDRVDCISYLTLWWRRKTEENLDGRNKEGHEQKISKWRPVGR